MDLNQLLHRHQLSLMQLDGANSPEERRAHRQFALDYEEKIHILREELGAPAAPRTGGNDIDHECCDDGTRHVPCVTARVVLTSAGDLPYTVLVSRDGAQCPGHAFATMRQAEAFIRRNLPAPAGRSTLYDREPGQA